MVIWSWWTIGPGRREGKCPQISNVHKYQMGTNINENANEGEAIRGRSDGEEVGREAVVQKTPREAKDDEKGGLPGSIRREGLACGGNTGMEDFDEFVGLGEK